MPVAQLVTPTQTLISESFFMVATCSFSHGHPAGWYVDANRSHPYFHHALKPLVS